MTIKVRRSDDRGAANFGWLDSKHSFSFGGYHDPANMGFGPLRVINEDRVAGGGGFPTHPHRDMEIISYVLEGGLAHRDSLGHASVIRPGDVQRMSAGTGVRHSEFNDSEHDPVHFLQIWIVPEAMGMAPSYEEKTFAETEKPGQLRLIGSRDGRLGSITIHRDVDLFRANLSLGEAVTHNLAPGRGAWVQIVRGEATINGEEMRTGDGASIEDVEALRLESRGDVEALVFDLALAA